MDIMVQGKANEYFTPDEVRFAINFYTKESSYNGALGEGTKAVEIFIGEVLVSLGFNKGDLKTKSFAVSEESKYIEKDRTHVPDGYAYRQSAFIKFDYDMKKVSRFMDMVSKLKNPPSYKISFGVKDEKECKSKVLAKAYNEAKTRAEAIATAASKNLKECLKIDFRPFEEHIISNSGINDGMVFEKARMSKMSSAEVIENIFTPEDVEISETIYCLWITD